MVAGMLPKNIVFVSIGTRGDVQPYCTVAQALVAQGHTVSIAAEKRLEPLVVGEFGLAFRRLEGDLCGALFHPDFHDRFRKARHLEFFSLMDEWYDRFDKQAILASFVTALEGADIVITGPLCQFETYCVAEHMRATWIPLFLGMGQLPTSAYPHWMVEDIVGNRCSLVNKWTYWLVHAKVWKKKRALINTWRERQLKLAPITSSYGLFEAVIKNDSVVQYQACSVLLSGPKRQVPSDYAPGKVVYTGFIFPTKPQPEPEQLKAFLNAKSGPVIYIGFGSMPSLEPLGLLQLAIDVCKLANCRGVLSAGWSSLDLPGLDELAAAHSDVVHVETGSISHPWLFPQMSCLVHHVGLGTMGAALRSGVPQVPCPFGIDQMHNSKILVQLGVAPCVVSKAQMTIDYVGKAVQRVLRNDNSMQDKARELGAFVASESADTVSSLCANILHTDPTFASASK